MSKVMGIFVKFWHFFTMPAHQIWSCHVTQVANFEKFLFFHNSAFNIRKTHKSSSGKALYFRSYQPKTSQGVENTPPPCAFRVNNIETQVKFPARHVFGMLHFRFSKYDDPSFSVHNFVTPFYREIETNTH